MKLHSIHFVGTIFFNLILGTICSVLIAIPWVVQYITNNRDYYSCTAASVLIIFFIGNCISHSKKLISQSFFMITYICTLTYLFTYPMNSYVIINDKGQEKVINTDEELFNYQNKVLCKIFDKKINVQANNEINGQKIRTVEIKPDIMISYTVSWSNLFIKPEYIKEYYKKFGQDGSGIYDIIVKEKIPWTQENLNSNNLHFEISNSNIDLEIAGIKFNLYTPIEIEINQIKKIKRLSI